MSKTQEDVYYTKLNSNQLKEEENEYEALQMSESVYEKPSNITNQEGLDNISSQQMKYEKETGLMNRVASIKKLHFIVVLLTIACLIILLCLIALSIVVFRGIENVESLSNTVSENVDEIQFSYDSNLFHSVNQTLLETISQIESFQKFIKNVSNSFAGPTTPNHGTNTVTRPTTTNAPNIVKVASSSCAQIFSQDPTAPSNYYTIEPFAGQSIVVYCEMNLTCGNISGGWMRIVQLDPNNCPTGLKTQAFGSTNACVKKSSSRGCTSVDFITFDFKYSRICGKLRGYGLGTLDGFATSGRGARTVSANYLDGIKFTSNGNHVWSFVGSTYCSKCRTSLIPAFVGNDYTCEHDKACMAGRACNNLLWGASINCLVERKPLFFKNLTLPTTANIVMSLCTDEGRPNEDLAITELKLFVY